MLLKILAAECWRVFSICNNSSVKFSLLLLRWTLVWLEVVDNLATFLYAKLGKSSFAICESIRSLFFKHALLKARNEININNILIRNYSVKWNYIGLKIFVVCLYTVLDSNNNFYTFRLHSCSLLANILQLISNARQLWRHFRRILWIIGRRCPKKYYWTLMTSLHQSARKLTK